jgi:hypothetical protein
MYNMNEDPILEISSIVAQNRNVLVHQSSIGHVLSENNYKPDRASAEAPFSLSSFTSIHSNKKPLSRRI